MVKKESSGWPDYLGKALKAFDYDADKALDALGQEIKGQLQQSIIDTMDPALSEVTLVLRSMRSSNPNKKITKRTVYEAIARVKSGQTSGLTGAASKPLIDTAHMLNSVDYNVS